METNYVNYNISKDNIKKPLVLHPKKEKRFFASLIDFGFALLLSFFLFYVVSFPIAKNYMNFDANKTESIALREQMLNLQVDAHLAEKNTEGEIISETELFNKYINNKVNEITYVDGKIVDNFLYYYTEYRGTLFPESGNKDIAWFNINILGLPQNINDANYSTCFQYDVDEDGNKLQNVVGVLSTEKDFSVYLKAYLDGQIFDKTSSAYSSFKSWYTSTLTTAKEEVGKSANYVDLYAKYVDAQVITAWTYGYAVFPVWAFSLLVFFAIIPMFFKYGSSLGKLILGIGVISKEGIKAYRFQIFFRGLIQSIGLLGFFCLVPFFDLGFQLSITLPIFTIFNYTINGVTIALFSGLVLAISFAMMILNYEETALHDLICQTSVVRIQGSYIYDNEKELQDAIEVLNKK